MHQAIRSYGISLHKSLNVKERRACSKVSPRWLHINNTNGNGSLKRNIERREREREKQKKNQ